MALPEIPAVVGLESITRRPRTGTDNSGRHDRHRHHKPVNSVVEVCRRRKERYENYEKRSSTEGPACETKDGRRIRLWEHGDIERWTPSLSTGRGDRPDRTEFLHLTEDLRRKTSMSGPTSRS
jgi:hypothetical protein